MNQSIKLFNELKQFLYQYSQKEIENILIISSGVLFSYGVRQMNDIDAILLPNENIDSTIIEKFNEKDKLDISYKAQKNGMMNGKSFR